jgi:hypothetical protein
MNLFVKNKHEGETEVIGHKLFSIAWLELSNEELIVKIITLKTCANSSHQFNFSE